MNNYPYKQSDFLGCEEICTTAVGGSANVRETLCCPKPRRVGAAPGSRAPFSGLQEDCESKAGNEILDIIRSKDGYGSDQLDSCSPYFSGSPPVRVSNPLIKDVRFGEENFSPNGPGCIWASLGNTPTVRVEGFDCLDRDKRNCNISTFF